MPKGMIIQCGSCGKLKGFDFDKPYDEIEKQIDDTISNEGWRYTKKWHGYICGSCRKSGTDPLYEAYFGKPKTESKLVSYVELRSEADGQIMQFKSLNQMGQHQAEEIMQRYQGE